MKALNAAGPPILNGLPGLKPIPVDEFRAGVTAAAAGKQGPVVIDLRDQMSYGAAHLPGAFGIGAGINLSTWASWVVQYDRPLWLVASREEDVEPAVFRPRPVGLDDVRGYLEGGMTAWIAAGGKQTHTQQLSPDELAARLSDSRLQVLDVRTDQEWDEGHIDGALHIMAGELPARLAEVPRDKTIVVVCGTGYRSTVAASVLERAGRTDVMNLTGGMAAWSLSKRRTG